MYGFVIINKPELKFREYDEYRSFYCGLCGTLRHDYGYLSAMCLSYDMTFLSILLNSLYEPESEKKSCRCACHMCKKHTEKSDKYSHYVAQMSLLTAYYKCLDDFHDDKNIIKYIYSLYLKRKIKKIEKAYPEKVKTVRESLSALSVAERSNNLEECANLFGNITGEIFTPENDLWYDTLYSFGFYLGKFIYIADAYTDIETDIEKNRHNPLKAMYSAPDFEKECEIILNMMAAEAANEFEKLPLIANVELLRNIIYSGIWTKCRNRKET